MYILCASMKVLCQHHVERIIMINYSFSFVTDPDCQPP